LSGLLEFYGEGFGVAGGHTTAQAMEWVKTRSQASTRYLAPGDGPLPLPGAGNVRAFVLGPPRDDALLRRSRPSRRHSEVYELAANDAANQAFLAATESGTGRPDAGTPFEAWFSIDDEASRKHDVLSPGYWQADPWRQIEDDWLKAADQLSLQLDSDTNNTSLALAFELPSRRVLLFPGDAQVGNWLSWESLKWRVAAETGTRTIGSADLLECTVLYKVGHHGSHNATLREKGLELMTSNELTALIPVRRATAEKKHWKMPFPSLYNRLLERTKGRVLDPDNGIPANKPATTSDAEWRDFVDRTEQSELWIDHWVKL
jgi:hypothetical protein